MPTIYILEKDYAREWGLDELEIKKYGIIIGNKTIEICLDMLNGRC